MCTPNTPPLALVVPYVVRASSLRFSATSSFDQAPRQAVRPMRTVFLIEPRGTAPAAVRKSRPGTLANSAACPAFPTSAPRQRVQTVSWSF